MDSMKTLKFLALALIFPLIFPLTSAHAAPQGGLLKWQDYGSAVFAQAARENRFIILELEAVWCHWCHVMDEKTWSDPRVAEAVEKNFIPVRVDHDARPDLAERYRDYGWPAIIFLDGKGNEIVKRAGYIDPETTLRLLAKIVADPRPEVDAKTEASTHWSSSPLLDDSTRETLEKRFVNSHDFALGGLKGALKMVDRDAAEYALLLAQRGDKQALKIARGNLAGGRALNDPIWGGIYQYSTGGDWNYPHFEKLGFIQGEYLRMLAIGYAQLRDPRDLATIQKLHGYLRRFMRSPEGSFYATQDADLKQGQHSREYFALSDKARMKLGIPRVDKNIYAKENGLIAFGLVEAHAATGDASMLEDAILAVNNISKTHALPGGGFNHRVGDKSGVYLADNLAMLRALLALHGATGEREWLQSAMRTADFIERNFREKISYTSAAVIDAPLKPLPVLDENIAMARAANLLYRYTGSAKYREMAEHAMRFIVAPGNALARVSDPGILIAAIELGNEPAHLTVVGSRKDAQAQTLFAAARSWPVVYKRVEWWDRSEGPLINPDVQYPALPKSAAYVCADGRCSRPLFTVEEFKDLAKAQTR
jgi:uncharacterized protein